MRTSELIENFVNKQADHLTIDGFMSAAVIIKQVRKMEKTAALWQGMEQAGIDNAEAYSYGYDIFLKSYPEYDEESDEYQPELN